MFSVTGEQVAALWHKTVDDLSSEWDHVDLILATVFEMEQAGTGQGIDVITKKHGLVKYDH